VSASSPIDLAFATARSEKRMAFMPFVTAGDPDVSTTTDLIKALGDQGVDLIEVGFPYSDPIADGPVIQASYTRALESAVSVAEICQGVERLTSDAHVSIPPLLAMVSYAIMFRHGLEAFLDEVGAAGFAGLIVPDLPGDEATECFEAVRRRGLDLVQLVAPTTPRQRVQQILKHCSGFVYCIAVSGITGEREQVAEALLAQLRWLRQETDLPLAVGFGISRPEHVDPLRDLADGVIVGSAIVKHMQSLADGDCSREDAVANVSHLAQTMVAAARGG
jgi:tryptophan synthase alpha chain